MRSVGVLMLKSDTLKTLSLEEVLETDQGRGTD